MFSKANITTALIAAAVAALLIYFTIGRVSFIPAQLTTTKAA